MYISSKTFMLMYSPNPLKYSSSFAFASGFADGRIIKSKLEQGSLIATVIFVTRRKISLATDQ